MSDRQIIVVDLETSGLDPAMHSVVEVAWHNLASDEQGSFVPQHEPGQVLAAADLQALRVNRYIDRLADAPQADWPTAWRFYEQLTGATVAGSNPTFDTAFLPILWRQYADRQTTSIVENPWHHRLLDLSAYAAGVLDLDPRELPGLARVAELCGVEHLDPHTAAGDVDCTVACFRVLMQYQAEKQAGVA